MGFSFTLRMLIIVCLLKRGLSLLNLARKGTATQSGDYMDGNYVTYGASKAIDGDTNQRWNGRSCGHTLPGQTAWWILDIGYVANIHRVVIYYRKKQSSRLDGFHLDISNSSQMRSGHQCFQDPRGGNRINTFQNITCNTVGQYVLFYNERQNPPPYAFVELCEVEVFGCRLGNYGTNCGFTCSGNCRDGYCDVQTGTCICKPGYRGARCTESCRLGNYGTNCGFTCSGNCRDGYCDVQTGTCICKPGYRGARCTEKCEDGTFGEGCGKRCHCLKHAGCDNVNGTCPLGKCDDGWKMGTCSEVCDNGTYGSNCSKTCGQCRITTESCHHINGTCPNRSCLPGWQGPRCRKKCDNGTFGKNCERKCHCFNGSNCDHVNGTCSQGCAPGWKLETCSKECDDGMFGERCRYRCHCLHGSQCNKTNGICPEGRCEPGWKSNTCHEECDDGMFGERCRYRCHCLHGSQCNKTNGICPEGKCEPGWKSNTCHEECDHGTFGYSCQKRCHCLNGVRCINVNGTCPQGECAPGWKLKSCSTECDDGMFGERCRYRCHCLHGSQCNKTNGICPEGKCEPGWKSNTCHEECDHGTFGYSCQKRCHCLNGVRCLNVNGTCPQGECAPGWKLKSCSIECDDGMFGERCRYRCHCLHGSQCNKTNGICPEGKCEPGWKSNTCHEECDHGTFGYSCQKRCHCLNGVRCINVNGTCPQGECAPGWKLKSCSIECKHGTYGEGCGQSCSNCIDENCDHVNGTCTVREGCKPGYLGLKCDEAATAPNDTSSTGIIVGIFVAVILLVVIVVGVCYRRRQQSRVKTESKGPSSLTNGGHGNVIRNNGNDGLEYAHVATRHRTTYENHAFAFDNDTNTENLYSNDVREEEKVYLNAGLYGKTSKYAVAVKDLPSMVETKKKRAAFKEEYRSLPMGSHFADIEGQKEENKPKNRYLTTFPYDHSRVQLTQSPVNDYINANYIKSYTNEKAYIATQGPKKNTLNDFWQMIWQENVGKIVMVTKLNEGDKKKCDQYWPLSTRASLNLEDFTIKMAMETERSVYIYRCLNLTSKINQSERTVHHFHFTQWPDHGVPDKAKLVNFHRKVKATYNQFNGPLLVHCSAGIGRTGTFIALDTLYEIGLKTGYVDIYHFTDLMRKDRVNMVQTCDQYIMVHDALVEAFTVNDTAIPVKEFADFTDPAHQLSGQRQHNTSAEFQKLQKIKPAYKVDKYESGKRKENLAKNAVQSILPNDDYRPYLMSFGKSRNDYINAVIIPSFTPNLSCIVTQCPLQGTVGDFWSLIYDNDCKTVVLLEPIEQNEHFIPERDGQEKLHDNFVISRRSSSITADNKILLNLRHKEKEDIRHLTLFTNKEWSKGKMTPSSDRNIVDLIGTVPNNQNSMAIICRDGCTRCGVFVTLKLVIEQIQMDEEVDIFQVVRRIQTRRPEFMPNLEQYEYCYRSIREYLKCDSLYANM